MDHLCFACEDVSKNLGQILTSDLDLRTGIGKEEYVWKTYISSILQAASKGCNFCSFVDYVFLKPYYDSQRLGSTPWRAASAVDDLSDEDFLAFISGAHTQPTTCLICSRPATKSDGGICYRCRPRVARYLANNREYAARDDSAGLLPLSIAIRKASWALDENTDVEGVSLKGYVETSNRHPLNKNETLFRLDCESRMFYTLLYRRQLSR